MNRPDTLSAEDVLAFMRRLADDGEDVEKETRLLLSEMRLKAMLDGTPRSRVREMFPADGSAQAKAFAAALKLTVGEVWAIVDAELKQARGAT